MMHVDDFLFPGTDGFYRNVIHPIARKYRICERLIKNFCYVGLNTLEDKSNTLTVNQN